MSTEAQRKATVDVSELRKFRHRVSARVRVLYGEDVIADETIKVDDSSDRHEFLQKAIGALFLHFPEDAQPTLETLDHALMNLVKAAEEDAQEVADNPLEERFAIDGNGCIVVQVFLEDQPAAPPLVLTNFAARIAADIQIDDGAEVRRVYELEAVLNGVRSTIGVPAEQFPDLGWLGRVAGAEAIIVAGPSKKDKVREAIQRLSLGKVEHRFTYAHLGWRVIRGEHVYLHAAGGIGPSGRLSDVDVRIPNALARYVLPEPPDDAPAALNTLFCSLDTLPDAIALPLVAAIVAAPLDALLGGIASVLVLGGTGMRKSSLVAALLHLAGGPWTAKTPPSTWESTANALERLAHACAQTAFWVDDVRPPATRREHDNTANATQRLLREVVTRAGRQRLSPDITARPVYFPRGPVVTTAELLPRGASTLARLLIVPMQEIADDVLTSLQDNAPALWPSVGAAWVQYVAQHYDTLAEILPSVFKTRRAETGKRCPGVHLGLVDSAAGYLTAWNTFLQFAIDSGTLDEEIGKSWSQRLQTALDAAIQTTHRALDTERAEVEYLDIVRALLEIGEISIDKLPGSGTSDGALSVGWYGEGVVYLKASLVDREVRRFYRDMGTGLPFPIEAARRGLEARGHLVRRDKQQFTITMRPPRGGGLVRVLAIAAEAVLEDTEGAS